MITSTLPRHIDPVWDLMGLLFRSHPWHGVSIGDHAPERVTCFIEMVPTDTVKYEIDKHSGYLTVDRPQKYSNVCPSLYGLLPQTYCGSSVAALSAERTGRRELAGDGDPLDVCVLTERPISHGDILLQAVPIGGLRMIDGDEADDKIIAVLAGDPAFSGFQDIADVPGSIITRLVHYFETYKLAPGATERPCEITHVYGRAEACEVIRLAQADYRERFDGLTTLLSAALRGEP
jgi:inorganic pyrophosphatase